MKKTIFIITALLASVGGYAETLLNAVPFKLAATTSGTTGTFEISLTSDDCAHARTLGFNIYTPTGMKCTKIQVSGRASDDGAFTTCSGSWKTAGYYKVTMTDAGGNTLSGTSGVIATVTYQLTADFADGVYPIYVANLKVAGLDDDDNTVNYTAPTNSYSYVVAGEGGQLTFDNAYELPSYVVAAMNNETSISKLDLTNITAINGSFALVDGREIVAPTAGVTVSNLTYDLTGATETAMKTIVLPYAVTVPAGVAYTTEGAIVGGYVHFDEATTIPANTPAIVTGDVNISLDNVTLVDATPLDVAAGEYYLAGSKFKKAASDFTAPVYRAKWALTGGEVKGFVLNSADGIKTVELNDVEGAEIFDLGGRKLNKATKGVNIIGGQKVLRK